MNQIGPYQLIRILGEGRMGIVWLAQHAQTGRTVALKQLAISGISPIRRQWFAQEIDLLARLRHPAIPRLCDAGNLTDDAPWFAMQFVEGQRPGVYCEQNNLTPQDRLALFCKICEAVRYVHSQDTIHRDVKSSNILIDPAGEPHLLDFGIARPTLGLDDPGISADIYALGAILCEMLTGFLPFEVRSRTGAASYPLFDPQLHQRTNGPRSLAHQTASLSNATWRDLDALCLQAIHPDAR